MTLRTMFFVYACLFSLLAACGSKDEKKENKSTADARVTNSVGGECGSQVVSDYRGVSLRCLRMRTREHAAGCKSAAELFLSRYPQADCTALGLPENGGQPRTYRIEAHEVREILDRLRRIGL